MCSLTLLGKPIPNRWVDPLKVNPGQSVNLNLIVWSALLWHIFKYINSQGSSWFHSAYDVWEYYSINPILQWSVWYLGAGRTDKRRQSTWCPSSGVCQQTRLIDCCSCCGHCCWTKPAHLPRPYVADPSLFCPLRRRDPGKVLWPETAAIGGKVHLLFQTKMTIKLMLLNSKWLMC